MPKKKLEIRCEASLNIPLSDLHPIQEDLKSMSNEDWVKCRATLVKDGIRFAFHVWKAPDRRWMIIDGHGRDAVMQHLVLNEQFSEPKVPCVIVKADSLEEAKRLVLNSSSTFHKITGTGLKSYLDSLGMEPAELEPYSLVDVNVPAFVAEHYQKSDEKGEKAPPKETKSKLVHECPKCGHQFR